MKIRKSVSVVLAALMLLSFTSCSKNKGVDAVIKCAVASSPKNLDPQLSADEPSLQVVANMFEGLMKKSGSNVENGMAQSYSVSPDGLVYTFNLKTNYYWVSKDKDYKVNVTAKDFVFAFRRLVNPVMHSPYARNYYVIKNGEAINTKGADLSTLGVEAVNDYVLKITLEKPYSAFLNLLAECSSSPCNEEFFYSTKGKYGLETASSVSNGPFYLYQWVNDEYGTSNYLILRRSKAFNEIEPVYPSGLNFFVNTDDASVYENFKKKTYSFVLGDGTQSLYFNKDFKNDEYKTKSIGFIINPSNTIIGDSEIRKALSISIDRTLYGKALPKGLSVSQGIVPPAVSILNKSFRDLVSEPVKDSLNTPLAQLLWTSSLTSEQKNLINSYTVIVPQSFAYSDEVEKVIEQWGQSLDFFISLEILPDKDYTERLKSGEYNIALYVMDAQFNSPMEYLNDFYSSSVDNNTSVSSPEYDSIIDKAVGSEMLNNSIVFYQQAEKYITDKYLFIPLFYQSEYLFYQPQTQGFQYDPFTNQVYFKNVKSFK